MGPSLTSYAAGLSLEDWWMPVASGGCLLLCPSQSVAEVLPDGADGRGRQLGGLGLQGLKLSFRGCQVLRLVGP